MAIPRSPIHSWTDAYHALKPYLEELRGCVEIDTADADRERWPRTTGRDAITIAALLDRALAAAAPIAHSTAMRREWHLCLADLDRYVWDGPDEVYPENRMFWHGVGTVCVHLDAAGEMAPDAATWRAFLLDFVHARPRNATAPRPWSLFMDAWRTYLGQRGEDDRFPPGLSGMLHYPRSTNGDAITLAQQWNSRLAAAIAAHPGKLDDAARKWNPTLAAVTEKTRGAPAGDVYADNQSLWQGLALLASSMDDVTPPDVASLVETATGMITGIFDDLPGNLERGASAVAHETGKVLGDVASGIGDVAGKVAKGFLGEFTTPLLIVGGGVAAIYLLTRSPAPHAEA